MARSSSMFFILGTVAIDSIGLGIIFPVLPEVIRRFVTEESSVSHLYGLFIAVYALMQFVGSPFLGRLSDRFGRRPIVLLSLFGAGVDYLFMAFAPSLPLLFLGRAIAGFSGASFTVASAYISDISTDANRSKNFGMIGAGFGIGFIAGPALGGLLAAYGPQYPFLAAAALNLANFVFGYFVLPESLAKENRRPIDYRALNPFRTLRYLVALPAIRTLVIVHTFFQLAGHTHPSVWTLYTHHRYGWSPAQIGLSLTVVGILSAVSQGALTGVIVKKWGEEKVLVAGCLGESISYFLFGIAPFGWMAYIILVLASPFWSAQPALQSMISRTVAPEAQGELQGSLMSLISLTAIINPVIMTSLFAFTSQRDTAFYLPGSPYLLGGVILLIAWYLARKHLRTTQSQHSNVAGT